MSVEGGDDTAAFMDRHRRWCFLRCGKQRDGELVIRCFRGLETEKEKDLGGALVVTVAISESYRRRRRRKS